MHFPSLSLSLLLPAVLAAASPAPPYPTAIAPRQLFPDTTPPPLTYFFDISVNLAKPLTNIPIPGGVLEVEPITNGTINGPVINGTLGYSFAHPTQYTTADNTTVHSAVLSTYGTSSDGETFFADINGVGSANEQWASIAFTSSGKYAPLNGAFIIGHLVADRETFTVSIECWCVGTSGC